MNEKKQIQPSGVPMVRIDGATVRRLREEAGYTQLYLATAVGVTTDTISRWENRSRPTIKRENGLRLAEILDVDLEAILAAGDSVAEPLATRTRPATRAGIPIKTYNLLINTALAVMIPLVIGLMIWKKPLMLQDPPVSGERVLPAACAPGLAFPVVLRINDRREVPLLIRETVPDNAEVVTASPPLTAREGRVLKWLRKNGGSNRDVGYLLRYEGTGEENLSFSGTITLRRKKQQAIEIGGARSLRLTPVHWADSNRDHAISDDEILEMYDRFGGIPGLARALDRAEDIWMGSGYRWNGKDKTIEILP